MLPKLDIPTHKLEIPSSKKVIEFRPFLVKEEKILLTMMEGITDDDDQSKAAEVARDAQNKVIANCILTDDIKLDKLTAFDVDYLFLQIRGKSRGEEISPSFTCVNKVDDETCGTDNAVHINIAEVGVVYPDEDYSKVELTDNIGIVFKYIDSKTSASHEKEKDAVTKLFKIIVDSIDYIYDEGTVYKGSETTKKELLNFIEELTESQFDKVKKFFDNQPVVKKDVVYKCSKCGYEETIPFVGAESFFGFA